MKWKTFPGYEGLYELSECGKIRRIDFKKPRILGMSDTDGYKYVHLCKNGKAKRIRLSRLMLETFVGPAPEGYQANHKDGDKANARIDNLEWCTRVENIQHRIKVLGIDHRMFSAKLTEDDVREIRRLHKTGMKGLAIGRLFPVINPLSIYRVIHKSYWTTVT